MKWFVCVRLSLNLNKKRDFLSYQSYFKLSSQRILSILMSLMMIIFLNSLGYGSPKVPEAKLHKVLVTGFYDWESLGTPPEVKRCRDNPSCRLLAGIGVGSRQFNGTLAKYLKELSTQNAHLEIDFALLPVTWGSANQLDLTPYQTVIHLGLGVYDTFHTINIEVGAYNLRRGRDAVGLKRDEPIKQGSDQIFKPLESISKGIERAVQAKLPNPFQLIAVKAREKNSYLCNETYYRTLEFVQKAQKETGQKSDLKEAYFVHIPHTEGEDEQPLSDALSVVLKALINL